MPRPDHRLVLDPDLLFTPGWFLRDDNADGSPDDLRARFVLDEEPTRETWRALIDLTARLGLETAGITFPLVTSDPGIDSLPIIVRNGSGAAPVIDPKGWQGRYAVVVEGPRAIQALTLAGAADRKSAVDLDSRASLARLDLLDLLEPEGLLTAECDRLPLGSRLCVMLPDDLPRSVGIGLIHLAARLGLESGGIDLPLATVDAPPPGAVPLRVLPRPGYLARLSVSHDEAGPTLDAVGDPEHLGDLLDRIARRWPHLPTGETPTPLRDVREWLRRSLAGWTPEGRLAALQADLAERGTGRAGGTIRLLTTEPGEQSRLAAVARSACPGTTIVGPGAARQVFAQEWSARWEVDRALDMLRNQVVPQLLRGLPLRLTLLVSEPKPIRDRVRVEIERLLLDAGFEPGGFEVLVLDTFKAGLGWIREVVLPAWGTLPDIDQVVIRYRPLTNAGSAGLELRIRWLQELFPVDEIVARALHLPLEQVRLEEWEDEALYSIEARDASGARLAEERFRPLVYRRPYFSAYPNAGSVHVVTGSVHIEQAGRSASRRIPTDLDLFWDYIQDDILPRVRQHILESTDGQPRRTDQPFFDQLRINLSISETDEPFGIREERLSAAEALHEDIYFNALDLVEEIGRQVTGERLNAPGAVVPFVHVRPGLAPGARISLTSRPRWVAQVEGEDSLQPIGSIDSALSVETTLESVSTLHDRSQIQFRVGSLGDRDRRRLRALGEIVPANRDYPAIVVVEPDGSRVTIGWPPAATPARPAPAECPVPAEQILTEARLGPHLERLATCSGARYDPALDWSWEGRPIPALSITAPMRAEIWSSRKLSLFKPTLLIVGRHHANEVASTTAALQLAEWLLHRPEGQRLVNRVNLAMLPFENPDGAHLHDLLQREHPTWKHHPARYNAVGFEFGEDTANPDSPYGEARVRDRLWHHWLPDIVADNHGVPSHEWAQVFAGFGSPPRFGVSYWQVQALVYGIIPYLDRPDRPEHRAAAETLRDAVARIIAADAELLALNRRYRERYVTWGASRVPERFPVDVYRDMIFNFGPIPEERVRAGRSYAARFPNTTVVTWVSEVADETAHGAQLRYTARAHRLVNEATMRLLAASATPPERRILRHASGTRITLARRRPIRLGP